jgi:hypothetical protein
LGSNIPYCWQVCITTLLLSSREFYNFVGMNVAAGPELAAAVTNAGGLGVIGGHGYTPKVLRQQVRIAAGLQLTWSFKCNAAA